VEHLTEKSVTDSLTTAVETGFEYEGFSTSITMTREQSSTVLNSLRDSISKSKAIKRIANCANPTGDLVALYQWRITGSRDGADEIEISDSHYICRYGVKSQSPPKCPYGYCGDKECETCIGDF
jgi:hypothetical protein